MIYGLDCSNGKVTWSNGSEHLVCIDNAFLALEVNGFVQVNCGCDYNMEKVVYYSEDGSFKLEYNFIDSELRGASGAKIGVKDIITVVPLHKVDGMVLLTSYNKMIVCMRSKSVEVNAPCGVNMLMLDIIDDNIKLICNDIYGKKLVYNFDIDTNKLEKISAD